MLEIRNYLEKSGITDIQEIRKIESIFENSEIKEELGKIEILRKKYIFNIIKGILISIFLSAIFIILLGYSRGIPFSIIIFIFSPFIVFFANHRIKSKLKISLKHKLIEKIGKYSSINFNYNDPRIEIQKIESEGKDYDGEELNIEKKYKNEIYELKEEKFINDFELFYVEDSINMDIENINIDGYELETTKPNGKGQTTTNNCYILKVNFPNSNLGLNSNIIIKNHTQNKLIIYILLIGMFFGITIFSFMGTMVGIPILIILLSSFLEIIFVSLIIFIIFRKNKPKYNKVKLENVDFGKIFDIYSNEQNELNNKFSDKIVNFVKNNNNKYDFLFKKDSFYIKRHIIGKFLKINIWKDSQENTKIFIDAYIEMKNINSLIKEINLIYYSKTNSNFY